MAEGCAASVLPRLKRVKPVTKSATAAGGQRPDPDVHYESLEVNQQGMLTVTTSITVVDDVITRGSTFLPCTSDCGKRCRRRTSDARVRQRFVIDWAMAALKPATIEFREIRHRCRRDAPKVSRSEGVAFAVGWQSRTEFAFGPSVAPSDEVSE
jgi:hypothetical protein